MTVFRFNFQSTFAVFLSSQVGIRMDFVMFSMVYLEPTKEGSLYWDVL